MITKKTWSDFKKRCGETDLIYTRNSYGVNMLSFNSKYNVKADFRFSGDEVIVTFDEDFRSFGGCYIPCVERHFNREEIVKITYKKYNP